MKKFILLLLLGLFCTNAYAAYTPSAKGNALVTNPHYGPNRGRITGHSIVLDQFNQIAFPGGTTAHNVAIGQGTLQKINRGGQFLGATDDISIGFHAGQQTFGITNNGESFGNVYIGTQAGEANTTGHANTGIGYQALQSVTTGIDDQALGYQALKSCTSCQFNVAEGIYAFTSVTTAGSETGIGTMAGRYVTGQNNTAIGYQAMCGGGVGCANTTPTAVTGTDNVAVGLQTLDHLTSGTQNVAVGTQALSAQTTVSGITAVGYHAGVACTGTQIALAGWAADANNTNCTDDTIFGYFAGSGTGTGHDNTLFGNFAGAAITSGSGNNCFGDGSCATGLLTGVNNLFLGNLSPSSDVSNSIGIGNVFPGSIDVTGIGTLATEVLTLHGLVNAPNLASSSAAQTGTVCWATGSGATAGRMTVDTTTTCLLSLEELKDKIGPIDGALSIVSKLKPFWFSWKKDTEEYKGDKAIQPGLGAHQVASVDKRLAAYNPDGTLHGVRYQELTAVLVAALQEQEMEIHELQTRNNPYSVHETFWKRLKWLFTGERT